MERSSKAVRKRKQFQRQQRLLFGPRVCGMKANKTEAERVVKASADLAEADASTMEADKTEAEPLAKEQVDQANAERSAKEAADKLGMNEREAKAFQEVIKAVSLGSVGKDPVRFSERWLCELPSCGATRHRRSGAQMMRANRVAASR